MQSSPVQFSSVQFVLTSERTDMFHMFSTYLNSPAKKPKVQTRKCEVAFPYTSLHEDELELVVGETIEIIREVGYIKPHFYKRNKS